MPTPNVPPSAIPTAERRQLEPGADDTDAKPRPLRADDHQRVARAGAEPGAEVERRSDAHQRDAGSEQRDPNAERVVREPLDGSERGVELDEAPDEDRVRDRADADAGAEPPRDREHDDADRDGRLAERQRCVPADPLMEHIPGRETEARLEQRDGPRRE